MCIIVREASSISRKSGGNSNSICRKLLWVHGAWNIPRKLFTGFLGSSWITGLLVKNIYSEEYLSWNTEKSIVKIVKNKNWLFDVFLYVLNCPHVIFAMNRRFYAFRDSAKLRWVYYKSIIIYMSVLIYLWDIYKVYLHFGVIYEHFSMQC